MEQSENSVANRTNATAARVDAYLAERGFKRADYSKMPVKKSEDPLHKRDYSRGNQFGYSTVPKTGSVYIIPNSTRHVNSRKTIRAYWDNETGLVYGVPTGFDKDGNLQWRAVQIDGNREINFSNNRDREDFFLIIHSHLLLNGANDSLGQGSLRVDDPLREAQAKINRMERSEEAITIIKNIPEKELGSFGVIFDGINPDQDPIIIKSALYDLAKADPSRIIREWNSKGRTITSVLRSAIHYGVVSEGIDGIKYAQHHLGFKLADAVVYLGEQSNIDLFGAIESAVMERNKSNGVSSFAAKKQPKTKPDNSVADREV